MSSSLTFNEPFDFEDLVIVIGQQISNHDTPRLANLLIEQGHVLLEQDASVLLREAFMALPADWRKTEPTLLFLAAQIKVKAGDLHDAIRLYQQAGQRYSGAKNFPKHVQCLLNLARIYHRLEDLEAARFYTEHAHSLLQELKAVDVDTLAGLHLAMSRLAPDIGRLDYSFLHSEKALHLYEETGDISNQLEAILLLAGAANQIGIPQRALSFVRIARARNDALNEDNKILWELAFCNQEAHCLWYLARLEEAAQVAEVGVHLADTVPHTKQRIYLRVLLGNIYRAQGRYVEARTCYGEAEALLEPLHYPLYRIWIQVQRAWLHILKNDYATGRQELRQALANCDQGQAMSFNVFLAGSYSLEGQFDAAEQLLLQSKKFYETSGDPLSVCAIQCHLAYVAIQKQKIEESEGYTKAFLSWLAEQNLCYFPHWWDNRIVGTVLVYGLRQMICPATAEQIILGPLRASIDSVIRPLFYQTATPIPVESSELGTLLDPVAQIDLPFADNTEARNVLAELLKQGILRHERFEELKNLLVTGKQRGRPNATLIAVFGLYLQSWSRRDMAQRLKIAEATVRNYVTLIYEVFHVTEDVGAHSQQRLSMLRSLAHEAGYIGRL